MNTTNSPSRVRVLSSPVVARHAPVDAFGSAPVAAHSSSVAAETFNFAHSPLEATIVGDA